MQTHYKACERSQLWISGEKPTYKGLEEKIAELESQLNYFSRDRVNRQAKYSVFLDLFSRPEYYLQIYKELFPNDSEITLDDLQLVTIKNVLAIHPYNDLGILARDKLIVLVEAQSEWSVNVIFDSPSIILMRWITTFIHITWTFTTRQRLKCLM